MLLPVPAWDRRHSISGQSVLLQSCWLQVSVLPDSVFKTNLLFAAGLLLYVQML